jgi:hypothetical protein
MILAKWRASCRPSSFTKYIPASPDFRWLGEPSVEHETGTERRGRVRELGNREEAAPPRFPAAYPGYGPDVPPPSSPSAGARLGGSADDSHVGDSRTVIESSPIGSLAGKKLELGCDLVGGERIAGERIPSETYYQRWWRGASSRKRKDDERGEGIKSITLRFVQFHWMFRPLKRTLVFYNFQKIHLRFRSYIFGSVRLVPSIYHHQIGVDGRLLKIPITIKLVSS